MRISFTSIVCVAFGGFMIAFAAPARAGSLDFTFSFSNTIGTTPGTVTGLIEGLSDNSTGAASDVILETAPAGLGSDEGPLPIDLNAASWTFDQNIFTTSGGQITGVLFFAQSPDLNGAFELEEQGVFNSLSLDDGSTDVTNANGLAGVTFTPFVPSGPGSGSVPLPASFKIGLATLSILGLWLWTKRTTLNA